MLTGQNVLLTGGGSPIGQGLLPRILEQDQAVRAYDNGTPCVISPEEYDISSFESQEKFRFGDKIIQSAEHASEMKKPELTDSLPHVLQVSLQISETLNKR